MTLTLGGRRFFFRCSLSWHCNARMGVVTLSCELMNLSKAIKQLLHHLAFYIHNVGLFKIELKHRVDLHFTVEEV